MEGECQEHSDHKIIFKVPGVEEALTHPEVEGVLAIIKHKADQSCKSDETSSTSGPAMVNSQAYRDNWEQIFRGKKVGKEELN